MSTLGSGPSSRASWSIAEFGSKNGERLTTAQDGPPRT